MSEINVFTIQDYPERMFTVNSAEAASLMVNMDPGIILRMRIGNSSEVIEITKTFLQNRYQLVLTDREGISYAYDAQNNKPLFNQKLRPVFESYGCKSLSVFDADKETLINVTVRFLVDREVSQQILVDPIPELSGYILMIRESVERNTFSIERGLLSRPIKLILDKMPLQVCRYRMPEAEYPAGPVGFDPDGNTSA